MPQYKLSSGTPISALFCAAIARQRQQAAGRTCGNQLPRAIRMRIASAVIADRY